MTNINKIIERVAGVESTQKLVEYWHTQFQQLFDNDMAQLDPSTLESLQEGAEINDKPIAPIAKINLAKHVGSANELDEIGMQTTVETMLRFLDNSIDVLNLSPIAKAMSRKYRRVAMGVINLEEYLTLRGVEYSIDEIDNVAATFSNGAYRSSEALAEEKGVCAIWNDMRKIIKPRIFEYWYNTENGEIYNGLEVAQMYTPETIITSSMEIIPRRNVSLLGFDLENPDWRDWGDRDSIAQQNGGAYANTNIPSMNINSNVSIDPSSVPQFDPGLNTKVAISVETTDLQDILPRIINSTPTKSFVTMNQQKENQSNKTEKEIFDTQPFTSEKSISKIAEEAPKLQAPSSSLNSAAPSTSKEVETVLKPPVKTPSIMPLSQSLLEKTNPGYESNMLLDRISNTEMDEVLLDFEPKMEALEALDLGRLEDSKIPEKKVSSGMITSPILAENKKDVFNNSNNSKKNNFKNRTNNLTTMSKFTIALQQIISSSEFDKILLNAQYDASGLKMVSVSGDKLSGELQSLVRSYIGLVNMSLSKGVTLADIAEELTEDSDQSSPAATRVLSLIADSLRELPTKITDVKADSIAPLDLKTVRQAIKSKRNVLEVIGE